MTVSKIIHQTWKTTDVPERWKRSEREWRAYCEAYGWEYKLWTDDDNRALIQEHYPWFVRQFDAYKYNIMRADAVRYFILHRHGGVYVDLDIAPKAERFHTLFQLYEESDVTLGMTKSGNNLAGLNYTNCLMMSSPKSPFWPLVWEYLVNPFRNGGAWKRVPAMTHYFHVLMGTGPPMVSAAANQYEGEGHTIHKVPAMFLQPGTEYDIKPIDTPESAVVVLDGSSWHETDANVWRTLQTNVVNNWSVISVALVVMLIATTYYFAALYRRALEPHPSRW